VRLLIHLALGTIHVASSLFTTLDASEIPSQTKVVLRGLLLTCQGRTAQVGRDGNDASISTGTVGDLVVANNEAVAMLDTGALGRVSSTRLICSSADYSEQAVETLRHAIGSHEPDSYAEPYIFNMASPSERRRRDYELIPCRRHWRN
jgi:hypothetical protein